MDKVANWCPNFLLSVSASRPQNNWSGIRIVNNNFLFFFTFLTTVSYCVLIQFQQEMSEESSLLTGGVTSKSRRQFLLTVLSVSMAEFGDSVELMIPAIVTQPVSCEMGLSRHQEQILAVVLYSSIALFSVANIAIMNRFTSRSIVLLSLFLSVTASIFCAVIPDYISLIVSRILLGATIALSMTPLGIYMSEMSPNEENYATATIIVSIGWSTGGGWCGILGYLFLERIGWRWFVLLTSVPLFLPPIVMFLLILPESRKLDNDKSPGDVEVQTESRAMITRIIKLVVLSVLRVIPYSGCILLLPSILREDNIQNGRESPCNSIHGIQFLTISLVFGVCHLIGKSLGYILHKTTIWRDASLTIFSILTTLSLIGAQFYHKEVTLLISSLCVVQILIAAMSTEIDILTYDKFFFTPSYLSIASSVRFATDFIGVFITNAISEFLFYTTVLHVHLCASVALVISSLLFHREN